MPRKYEVPIFTGCGHAVSSCRCKRRNGEAATGKVVIAVDERDVSPLVEAARKLQEAQTVYEVVLAHQAVVKALKPFEAEEGSG